MLYVDNGALLTSAGATAGDDLCLYLLRRDFGATVAANVARRAVMPLERAGGQAQFFVLPLPDAAGRSLAPLLDWIEDHLDESLSIGQLAHRASMSPRSLARHFKEQVGWTPAQRIARARVRRAQHLLESTPLSIEQVAVATGFGSTAVLRARFSAVVGCSPAAYRRTYRGT